RPRTAGPERRVASRTMRWYKGSSEKTQVWSATPPVPRPLSGPGSGPVTKLSRETEMSATTLTMGGQSRPGVGSERAGVGLAPLEVPATRGAGAPGSEVLLGLAGRRLVQP